jgi:hypothetical protein
MNKLLKKYKAIKGELEFELLTISDEDDTILQVKLVLIKEFIKDLEEL